MELLKKQLEILAKMVRTDNVELSEILSDLGWFEKFRLSDGEKELLFPLFFTTYIETNLKKLTYKAFEGETYKYLQEHPDECPIHQKN